MSHFVEPAIDRIPLEGDGLEAGRDWLDVKHELTTGELLEMGEATRTGPGAAAPLVRIETYVVAWSFVDADGRPVPFTRGALQQLRPPIFKAINEAIVKHVSAVEAAYEAEKKTIRDGPITSDRGLRSVS
jgi:hypothetical protein